MSSYHRENEGVWKRDEVNSYINLLLLTIKLCCIVNMKLLFLICIYRNWKVIATGGSVFETRYGYTAYKVDLEQHYCTCRLWEISGIPCVRGQAAINYTHMNPTDFLSIWFQKEKFMAAYTTNISPVNGSNLWAPTDYIKPLTPLTRRMTGRPKTKRRRHVSEVNDSKFPTVRARVCRTVRCSKCLQFGHNLKSCKNERVMKEYVPPRKPGRPRGVKMV